MSSDINDIRTGHSAEAIRRSFIQHVEHARGKAFETASIWDCYMGLAAAVRDRMSHVWARTSKRYYDNGVKYAYYLSAEYLLGRALENNLINTGLLDNTRNALEKLGIDFAELLEMEPDAGLGNGGLGRLAACYLDSLATLDLPAIGYGIRYEFGIFTQNIIKGWQVERADEWLRFGSPWELVRPDRAVPVRFYGNVENQVFSNGFHQTRWVGGQTVIGIPWDTPIVGYGATTVNTLRLWQARASEEFDLAPFNDGDYERSVVEKNNSEVISKVLYPNDHNQAGKELRLKQEYFFVACSIADIMRRYLNSHLDLAKFPDKVAIQLNDTHPAIAVAELMRVLVDDKQVPWSDAWSITCKTFGYTNHTLLPEALEQWPVSLIERLLPRHLQIIYDINQHHLKQVRVKWPSDGSRTTRMSLIEESREPMVRMAYLAVLGAHSVNGVAELHSKLLREETLKDFATMFPERFNNKTNGVTPRRWLLVCNPPLARLITDTIGDGWIKNLDKLRDIENFAEDTAFVQAFAAAKHANKEALASHLRSTLGISVDPRVLFDVHVKRLHEYKRQLLNALHIIHLWLQVRRNSDALIHRRVFLFGAKAAPGYRQAKLIIRLINGIADVVNSNATKTGLQVIFVPNYRVSLAERIIPAADISEQISTAGMEASGTGNMKFAMNGALTVGTLDGANLEIRDLVGAENFFLFGHTAEEVEQARREGYVGRQVYEKDAAVREVLDLVASGFFSSHDKNLFRPLVDALLNEDKYFVLADFASYIRTQREVARAYIDTRRWWKRAIINVARMGFFSSDRSVSEYARDIWHIHPVREKRP